MADPQVLNYILTQQRAGFSENQIRGALAQQGYPMNLVDEAFAQTKQQAAQPSIPLADENVLREYVQSYAQQGYTSVQIEDQLVKQGYQKKQIDNAIRSVLGSQALPEKHHGMVIAIFLLFAIGAGTAGFFLLTSDGRTPLPDDRPIPETPPIGGTGSVISFAQRIDTVIATTRAKGKDAGIALCQSKDFQGDDRDQCLQDVATMPEVHYDAVCDLIVNPKPRDTCLLSFVDTKAEAVCQRVSLIESRDYCDSLFAFSKVEGT